MSRTSRAPAEVSGSFGVHGNDRVTFITRRNFGSIADDYEYELPGSSEPDSPETVAAENRIMYFSRTLASIALAFVTLALACTGGGYASATTAPTGTTGGATTGNTPPTATTAVSVADNNFSPAAITVARGATVTWTWTGRNPHTVTFDDGTTSAQQTTGTYQRAFAAAGTYPYHCVVHGTLMSGTVTVQ